MKDLFIRVVWMCPVLWPCCTCSNRPFNWIPGVEITQRLVQEWKMRSSCFLAVIVLILGFLERKDLSSDTNPCCVSLWLPNDSISSLCVCVCVCILFIWSTFCHCNISFTIETHGRAARFNLPTTVYSCQYRDQHHNKCIKLHLASCHGK